MLYLQPDPKTALVCCGNPLLLCWLYMLCLQAVALGQQGSAISSEVGLLLGFIGLGQGKRLASPKLGQLVQQGGVLSGQGIAAGLQHRYGAGSSRSGGKNAAPQVK